MCVRCGCSAHHSDDRFESPNLPSRVPDVFDVVAVHVRVRPSVYIVLQLLDAQVLKDDTVRYILLLRDLRICAPLNNHSRAHSL